MVYEFADVLVETRVRPVHVDGDGAVNLKSIMSKRLLRKRRDTLNEFEGKIKPLGSIDNYESFRNSS